MKRAAQMIIAVRADERQLGTDVAAILPTAAANARGANRKADNRGWYSVVRHICPVCGGTKTVHATRCRSCFQVARRRGHGLRVETGSAIRAAHPNENKEVHRGPGFGARASGRVRGSGTVIPQPERTRMVKRDDGTWVRAEDAE